jgi:ureidoglycolate hydrolase
VFPDGSLENQRRNPPPSPALWVRAPAASSTKVVSYKKGEWRNPLNLLNPKRQFLSVNRQIATVF